MHNRFNDFALLYAYSEPMRTLQIANAESGADWVNIGTNGYCELPHFKSGTRVLNRLGCFEDIDQEMEQMMYPLELEHP